MNKEITITSGYKKTSAGIIPEDWEVKRINHVSDVIGGYAFDSKKFKENGLFQVIKMSNVYQGTLDLKRSKSFITGLTDREKDYLLLKGDILISLTGTVGKEDYGYSILINDEENLLLNQRLAKIIANQNALSDFLFYIIKTPIFLRSFFNFSRGGTGNQANVSVVDLGKIKLPIPPLPEQKAIADCLSTWDRAIEKQTQLIHAKKEFKKGLMQGFFNGQLSVVNEQGTMNNEQGTMHNGQLVKAKEGEDFTEDWEEVRLGEIGEFKTSSVNKKIEENEIKVKLLNYMDVYRNTHITSKIQFQITSAKPTQIESTKVEIGDILFTPSSETPDDIGHSAVVIENLENVVYSYHLVRMRPKKNKLDIDFSGYVFNKEDILNEFSRRATGSTRYTLSIKDFKDIKTKIPNLKIQTTIAQVLQSADKEIELLEKKLEQLKVQKKGLMQVLLTGEKRLV